MAVLGAFETEEGREPAQLRLVVRVGNGPVRVGDLGAVDEQPAQFGVLPDQRVQQFLNGAACFLIGCAWVARALVAQRLQRRVLAQVLGEPVFDLLGEQGIRQTIPAGHHQGTLVGAADVGAVDDDQQRLAQRVHPDIGPVEE